MPTPPIDFSEKPVDTHGGFNISPEAKVAGLPWGGCASLNSATEEADNIHDDHYTSH